MSFIAGLALGAGIVLAILINVNKNCNKLEKELHQAKSTLGATERSIKKIRQDVQSIVEKEGMGADEKLKDIQKVVVPQATQP